MRSLGLFTLTIFLSAALLFSVQPLFARMVLPLLGGTPAVWITCMFFFQALLLAGYGYAHLAVKWLGTRRQSALHALLVWAPLVVLPISIPGDWSPPEGTNPTGWLLGLLLVRVGAPFFLLSATNPLLQHWFANTSHERARDPYFLYAASNLGSMLALLCYPIVVEPYLPLAQQSLVWTWGFALLAACIGACALWVWLKPRDLAETSTADVKTLANKSSPKRSSKSAERAEHQPVRWRRRAWWIALSCVPSSWMLGLTTSLTTDIAPIPLLWIIPLALYLLTFIFVFARRHWIPQAWYERVFPWCMLLLAVSLIFQGVWQMLLLHLVVFFVGCMVCHGELARDRPDVAHLTEYYFWMSFGGVLGGVLNAVIAPVLFPTTLEYPLTLAAACWLRPRLRPREAGPQTRHVELALLGFVVAIVALFRTKLQFQGTGLLVAIVLGSVPILLGLYFLNRPRWFAFALGVLLLAQKFEPPQAGRTLYLGRSYFGVHRVIADPHGRNWLMHGTTTHGIQVRADDRRDQWCTPLTYYYPTGPLGDVFRAFRAMPSGSNASAKRRVALIGLGAGAAACYRQSGDEFTFYEIDPVVIKIAETPEYFSYLSGCAKEYRIIVGDGRFRLKEAENGEFEMIVLDAFSSDAIPVHLLTREAIALYLSKLTDDGLLAFHISNTHLDLAPVLANLAADAKLVCYLRRDDYVSDDESSLGKTPSTWAILARRPEQIKALAERSDWRDITPTAPGTPWTDDFSNLVGILKWWE